MTPVQCYLDVEGIIKLAKYVPCCAHPLTSHMEPIGWIITPLVGLKAHIRAVQGCCIWRPLKGAAASVASKQKSNLQN